MHHRLLALAPVLVLALIFVSVFVSLRTAPTPPPVSPAPATSAEAVAVSAPYVPELVATTPDEVARMEAAGLTHPLVPLAPESDATVSDSQWRQACLEAEGWRGNPPFLDECVQRGLSVDTDPGCAIGEDQT